MNDDSASFLTYIWQHKPMVIVLLIGVVIVSILVVVDTYRHRKKKKGRHPKLH